MKRKLFGLTALTLAIMASAFTFKASSDAKVPEPTLYWYTYSGGDLTGFVAHDERTDVAAAQSVCKLSMGTECIRGFESAVSPAQYSPAPTGVDKIRKTP